MIDVHTHILPQMDDGSRSVDESLRMLREEKRQGVDKIVLTSHFYAFQNSPQEFIKRRREAWNKLQDKMEDGLPELYLGAEVQYYEGICRTPDLTSLCAEDSNIMLLEMPFSRWSERTIRDVLELSARGDIKIMLAHIERYIRWHNDDFWPILKENGVLMQVNAGFFLNWKTAHKAKAMLKKEEIQFIGSDCHNMELRAPNMGRLPKSVRSANINNIY